MTENRFEAPDGRDGGQKNVWRDLAALRHALNMLEEACMRGGGRERKRRLLGTLIGKALDLQRREWGEND